MTCLVLAVVTAELLAGDRTPPFSSITPIIRMHRHTSQLLVEFLKLRITTPMLSCLSLHLVLATEGAGVLGVLGDLHLLDGLPQRGSIPEARISCYYYESCILPYHCSFI